MDQVSELILRGRISGLKYGQRYIVYGTYKNH